ncbi:MAG: hypothetical protein EAZ07_03880 [Cytophagales bacterium]|nr:MAG: hypothetical protein EAZ07_03880 [Cytophagales bacterium]
MAEGEKTIEMTKSKPIISSGFLLNLGFAFPSVSVPGAPSSSSFQTNLEIGNQWYFAKTDKYGIGLKVSWFQFGYGSKSEDLLGKTLRTYNIDLRFIKVAPMFSYAINDDMALDAYVDLSPTVIIQGNELIGSIGAGLLFVPGARFRYKKFAFGFDTSIGSMNTASTFVDDDTDFEIPDYKASYFIPRIYVGFKF